MLEGRSWPVVGAEGGAMRERLRWAQAWTDRLVQDFASRHRQPFNIVCHLVGMPVIAAGMCLILFWVDPLAGLFCMGGGFTVTFTGHLTEGSPPVLATPAWYASLGAPFWWGRHLISVALTGRLWRSAPLPD